MTKPERAHLYVTANTHSGMRGKNNEDRYAVSTHRFGPNKDIPSVLAVVCDGIGGHRAGEVAAEIAVETISKAVAESDGSQPLVTLEQAIQNANEAVHAQADANPDRQGMGSTCVCAWVIGEHLYTVSVGDSRLYILRDDAIQQITTDHTWIQEAIEFGALTPEQARGHPNAHVIRRYLGAQTPPEIDFRLRLKPDESDEQALANQGTTLKAGDILLLVSDGLTDLVEPQEIQSALQTYDRKQALQKLIDLANERGGHDNITTVMLEVPANFGQSEAVSITDESTAAVTETAKTVVAKQSPKTLPNKLVLPCIVIAFLITLLSAVGVGLYLYFRQPEAIQTSTPAPEISPSALPALPEEASSTQAPAVPTLQATPTTAQDTAVEQSPVEQVPREATFTPWPTNTLPPPSPTQTALPPTETPTATPSGAAP